MSIPPVSSEDLAELVLGYLADEQLMTVYDEFLMASPHVDSHKNEYKRIWMKSLHSIVDEYWAIKIFVEKCKPVSLRRKLIQCSNLLDIFKFLILNVDMKKVIPCANISHNKISVQTSVSPNGSHKTTEASNNLVEATSLADLPGNNHFPGRRKQVKILDKDSAEAARLTANLEESNENSIQHHSNNTLPRSQHDVNVSTNVSHFQNDFCVNPSSAESNMNLQTSQNTQHFSQQSADANLDINIPSIPNSNVTKHSYQEFTTTCEGGPHNINTSLPDSSTSESGNLPLAKASTQLQQSTPHNSAMLSNKHMTQLQNQTQYLLQVSNTKNVTIVQSHADNSINGKTGEESKITILSDIKVDARSKSKERAKPAVLQNTSSPFLQLQTIVVNGTPAYKPEPTRKLTFTRDEIMAMPTLIVVSAPGPPLTTNTVKTTSASSKPDVTSSTSSTSSLQPLVIDISDSPIDGVPKNMPSLNLPTTETNLPTGVDLKNASVPKDSMVAQGKTSTPHGLPPTRKASSTPRRSSHIRVLDFTTPRRILHETINENPVEVMISRSPNLQLPVNPLPDGKTQTETQAGNIPPEHVDDDSATKENKTIIPKKKSDWDADLRALAVTSTQTVLLTKSTPRVRSKKKKQTDTNSEKNKKSSKKKSPKQKNPKKKKPLLEEVSEESGKNKPVNVEVAVKPTINVITDWNNPAPETERQENKSESDAQVIVTPEMERLSLQNTIDTKLNISDLLETPYKQALYEIQMDTPKFLRPDIPIPDDPVSEIKITDIPTPRFFDTPNYGYPKPSQATPSSYSSRPTDYSSGGSYYKPDEQDFMPRSEDLGSPIKNVATIPERKTHVVENKDRADKESKDRESTSRPSRPVRQCAKNVTYCDIKSKTLSKSSDLEASTNDSTMDNDSEISDHDNSKNENTVKQEIKLKSKVESKRKSSSSFSNKKRKSPSKTAQKPFMKIKPRSTPKQDSKRKSYVDSSHSKAQSRKRTLSKDKSTSTQTSVTPAPTKSRRKSSTPRKLHTKVITSSSESPEINLNVNKSKRPEDKRRANVHDSDNENLPLRWSDECSQDVKTKVDNLPTNQVEDISQIKAYIEESLSQTADNLVYSENGSLHIDLVRRGFDIETARSIERDLLDTSPQCKTDSSAVVSVAKPKEISNPEITSEVNLLKDVMEKSDLSNNLEIITEEEDIDEIELSTYECNVVSKNYISCVYDDTVEPPKTKQHKLKDNFTMEFCIEDDAIRLKTTAFTILLDEEPKVDYDEDETEAAASSIPHYDRLYTPLKESIQAHCREIFDSTLASLDTPMKADSPSRGETTTVSEIYLEVEQVVEDNKEKSKKRKRTGLGSDEAQDNKRVKKESRLLPNIQNIDIESVLSKLHGP